MGMSFDRRKRACLYHIDNGYNTDRTVAWMRKEFQDDVNILRAKNPDKLCRNIVTVGGSGNEKDMNYLAFRMALDECHDRDRKAMRAELDKARVIESELRNRVESLQDELRAVERERSNDRILALQAAVEPS